MYTDAIQVYTFLPKGKLEPSKTVVQNGKKERVARYRYVMYMYMCMYSFSIRTPSLPSPIPHSRVTGDRC